MNRLLMLAVAVAVALATPALAQPNTSTRFPAVTAVTLSTTSAQIIGTNPTRRYIEICNPSAVVVWIAPSPVTALANGAGNIGLPAASSGTTVCYRSPQGADAGNAWNGIAASATPGLTVIEW